VRAVVVNAVGGLQGDAEPAGVTVVDGGAVTMGGGTALEGRLRTGPSSITSLMIERLSFTESLAISTNGS
jgi:hypothetical protein